MSEEDFVLMETNDLFLKKRCKSLLSLVLSQRCDQLVHIQSCARRMLAIRHANRLRIITRTLSARMAWDTFYARLEERERMISASTLIKRAYMSYRQRWPTRSYAIRRILFLTDLTVSQHKALNRRRGGRRAWKGK